MPNYAGCELCWTNVLVGDVYQLERHGQTVYVCAKCKTRLLMTNVIHFDGRTNEQKALHDLAGGLTTDAPEMTVGDSLIREATCICVDLINNNPDPIINPDCPVHGTLHSKKQGGDVCENCLNDPETYICTTCGRRKTPSNTNNTDGDLWECHHCGYFNYSDENPCGGCGNPRPESTAKPDDFTSSPTPSFR